MGGGRDKGDAHGPMSGTVRSRAGGRWQQPRMSPDGQGCLPMTKGQGWPRPGATKSQGRQPRLSLSLSLLRSQSCRPNRAGALAHWCIHPLVHSSAEWQSGRVAPQSASTCIRLQSGRVALQSPPESTRVHPPASACIHLHPPASTCRVAEWHCGVHHHQARCQAQLWQLQ